MLSSRKCVPIERGGTAASAFPREQGTLFTVARLGPHCRDPSSHHRITVMWQLQKVEPPHGAITPWDAHPDLSNAGNLSSPDCPRINGKIKSIAFSLPMTPASWSRPLGSFKKGKPGPRAKFATPDTFRRIQPI